MAVMIASFLIGFLIGATAMMVFFVIWFEYKMKEEEKNANTLEKTDES